MQNSAGLGSVLYGVLAILLAHANGSNANNSLCYFLPGAMIAARYTYFRSSRRRSNVHHQKPKNETVYLYLTLSTYLRFFIIIY